MNKTIIITILVACCFIAIFIFIMTIRDKLHICQLSGRKEGK